MKRILILLAVLWVAPIHAQSLTKLCFPTAAGSNPSCQDVRTTNPLPVTIGGGGSGGGALNVSVTNTVAISPSGVTTTISTGSITTANTFVQALAANTNRMSCTLQNTSSATMFAFFGPSASALTGSSLQLGAGQSVSCFAGSVVLRDALQVTTAVTNSNFVVNSQ